MKNKNKTSTWVEIKIETQITLIKNLIPSNISTFQLEHLSVIKKNWDVPSIPEQHYPCVKED